MTRETRIAMLVGLLFIVMFGLVLSELTGSPASNPPPTLKASIDDPAKRFSPVIAGEPLQIDQGRDRDDSITLADDTTSDHGMAADPCSLVDITVLKSTSSHNEPNLTATDFASNTADNRVEPPARDEPKPLVYTVQEKDSLIKLASIFYGPANEKAYVNIAKANEDRIKSQTGLKVGQEIIIPPLPGGKMVTEKASHYREVTPKEFKDLLARGLDPRKLPVPSAAPAAVVPAASPAPRLAMEPNAAVRPRPGATPVAVVPVASPAPRIAADPNAARVRPGSSPAPIALVPPAPTDKKVYEVRKGDSLGKIARQFLKSDSREAIQKLYVTNRGVLKSPDDLKVGMKLEIPS